FDSCQPVVAAGAMPLAWMASCMNVSARTFRVESTCSRSSTPPKLMKAVTTPSYRSPSNASPCWILASRRLAASASTTSRAGAVGEAGREVPVGHGRVGREGEDVDPGGGVLLLEGRDRLVGRLALPAQARGRELDRSGALAHRAALAADEIPAGREREGGERADHRQPSVGRHRPDLNRGTGPPGAPGRGRAGPASGRAGTSSGRRRGPAPGSR